jgi:hypothetical protein
MLHGQLFVIETEPFLLDVTLAGMEYQEAWAVGA